MSESDDFKKVLDDIDMVLGSYHPGELAPDTVVSKIFAGRARQRPILEKVVQMTTLGLEKYTYNTELLRRRAYARFHIVTSEGQYPEIELAENDLRTILKLDPNNLYAGLELLDAMFTFSGMDDSDVANVADEFAERTESLLLRIRALQIKVLSYAGEHQKAAEVYDHWIKLFPDSSSLRSAMDDFDSTKEE